MSNMSEMRKVFLVGLDVGSTTTKIAAIDQETHEIQYYDYKRHHAAQKKSVYDALSLFKEKYPDALVRGSADWLRSQTSGRGTGGSVYSGSCCQFHCPERSVL